MTILYNFSDTNPQEFYVYFTFAPLQYQGLIGCYSSSKYEIILDFSPISYYNTKYEIILRRSRYDRKGK